MFSIIGKFKDLIVTSESGKSRFRMLQTVVGANLYIEEMSAVDVDSMVWVELLLKPYVATGSTTDTGRTWEVLCARTPGANVADPFEAELWANAETLDPVFVEKRAYNPQAKATAKVQLSGKELAEAMV